MFRRFSASTISRNLLVASSSITRQFTASSFFQFPNIDCKCFEFLESKRFCCSTKTTNENEEQQEGLSIMTTEQQQKGDYYRIETLDDARPPEEVIEWRSARGSGPGGQGVNSSQNKAELRVNLQKWNMIDPVIFDLETFEKMKSDFGKKYMTATGDILIISSHLHRSLEKNKEECLATVKKMVRDASYVAPALNPVMKFDPDYVKRVVMPKKRFKSNMNKIKRSVKSGNW